LAIFVRSLKSLPIVCLVLIIGIVFLGEVEVPADIFINHLHLLIVPNTRMLHHIKEATFGNELVIILLFVALI